MHLKSPHRLSPPVVLAALALAVASSGTAIAAGGMGSGDKPIAKPNAISAVGADVARPLVRSESPAVLTGRCCRVWAARPRTTVGGTSNSRMRAEDAPMAFVHSTLHLLKVTAMSPYVYRLLVRAKLSPGRARSVGRVMLRSNTHDPPRRGMSRDRQQPAAGTARMELTV